jgi:endonuclease/exonuclease/phosphatase family metal-dependent hydrolase
MGHRRTLALRSVVAGIAAVALMASLPATAQARDERGQPRLTVMTRNIYLGASLTPALTATTPQAFLGAVATIYGTALFTNFPARAEALADEIATTSPDLIGLQEVSQWLTTGPGTPPSQDFLEILRAAMASRGLDYSVASVSDNANIGPVPLVSPCSSAVVGACTVTLNDRDVILVRDDKPALHVFNPQDGNSTAQQFFAPPLPGAPPVSFNRGWASIDGKYRGERFHFVNTHLETQDFPAVQVAQAQEFLAGPAFDRGADIAVGDFNSAADGSTTASYALLTGAFTDAWVVNPGDPGYSCCQSSTLTDPLPAAGSRIDLVLSHGDAAPVRARLVGDTPFQGAPPFWASDHYGVVATLRLG